MLSETLIFAGLLLIVAAAWRLSEILGMFALGVLLVFLGYVAVVHRLPKRVG